MEPAHTDAAPGGGDRRIRPGRALLRAVGRVAPQLRPATEKLAWRAVYELASLRARSADTALNYGYAPLDAQASGDTDYGLLLYEKIAGAIDLKGLDVLEVGCGRGVGAARVFERFAPRSLTGLDLAASAVRRAQSRHGRPGLRFLSGDAENLPFPGSSYDAVLNVESSHCYPDTLRFLSEVHRVLRPGGHLLIADLRHTELGPNASGALINHDDVATLRTQIGQAGFAVVEEEDITDNVIRALELDTPRRRARIERTVPRPLQPHALAMMAVEGTPMFGEFAERKVTYLRFCLQKA
jgi:SAM-dependent methyltransferase